jgi:hypothetical protein
MRALSFEQAIRGPFAGVFSDFDASAWLPFLRALDGNAPDGPKQLAMFEACTGRTTPFVAPPRQAQICAGRRSGKTRIAALCCATAAAFWTHTSYLAKRGERARIPCFRKPKTKRRLPGITFLRSWNRIPRPLP